GANAARVEPIPFRPTRPPVPMLQRIGRCAGLAAVIAMAHAHLAAVGGLGWARLRGGSLGFWWWKGWASTKPLTPFFGKGRWTAGRFHRPLGRSTGLGGYKGGWRTHPGGRRWKVGGRVSGRRGSARRYGTTCFLLSSGPVVIGFLVGGRRGGGRRLALGFDDFGPQSRGWPLGHVLNFLRHEPPPHGT